MDVKVQRERQVDTIKHINSGRIVPIEVVTNKGLASDNNSDDGLGSEVFVVIVSAMMITMMAAIVLILNSKKNKNKRNGYYRNY